MIVIFMKTNNTIKELDVSNNYFNSEGIIAFMRMLLINKTLTNVNFNNISTFNNDAVKSMSHMFAYNTTLNTLTMINTSGNLENYWLLNTNWTTHLKVGLESNYSLTTFETNIVSSKISNILTASSSSFSKLGNLTLSSKGSPLNKITE